MQLATLIYRQAKHSEHSESSLSEACEANATDIALPFLHVFYFPCNF